MKRESWSVKREWDDIHDTDGRASQADDDGEVLEDNTEQAEDKAKARKGVGGVDGFAALSTTCDGVVQYGK